MQSLPHSYLQILDRKLTTALDVETCGNQAHNPNHYVVGVGLSQVKEDGSSVAVYFPITSQTQFKELSSWLQALEIPLIAHNLTFDAAWFIRDGFQLNWKGCTYAYYRMLANEGWAGQTWGLKSSMIELLSWPESNEESLDLWLINNGFVKSISKVEKDGYYWIEEKQRWLSPKKSDMWRAPQAILGKYCCLDAFGTIELYNRVLCEVLESNEFSELYEEYSKWQLTLILKTIEQQLNGIEIRVPMVEAWIEELKRLIEITNHEILTHPQVVPSVTKYNQAKVQELLDSPPKQFKKDGTQSKLYDNWLLKVEEAKQKQYFNLNSSAQKQWLFYEELKFPQLRETDSGQAAVDSKALLGFGEVGALFSKHNGLTKELGYVEKCLELTKDTGVLHPQLRVPGTLTGRCSGSGGLNIQQLPKSKEYLEAWVAREGKVWVDFDFCLHPKTELLTKRGWVKVLELNKEDEVWQVNPDTRIGSWVIPSRIINKEYFGKMYEIGNTRGKFSVTENHTMLWYNQLNRGRPVSYKVNKSQEGLPSQYYSTILTATNNNEIDGEVYSRDELFKVALLQADAHYQGPNFVLQLSLPRKRELASRLLGRTGSLRPIRKGHNYPVEIWCGIPNVNPLLKNDGKRWNLRNLSPSCSRDFVDALLFWDGSKGKKDEVVYCCTDTYNLDEVQAYLVRSGWEAKRRGKFNLAIRPSKGIRLQKSDIKQVDYEGRVGCVTVPTGFILIRSEGQTFITGNCAIEPIVLTELSKDKAMMSVYGPTAGPNDIYLLTGSSLPGLKDKILAAGYNPRAPTQEGINNAKRLAKKERSVSKIVTLGSNYGMGAKKLMDDLALHGFPVSLEQAKQIHRSYWTLYSGIKEFESYLIGQWETTGGWVLNGIGRPICVAPGYEKDIVNRVVQSTAHDLLMYFIHLLVGNLKEAKLDYKPIIIDFHDQSILEVSAKDSQRTADIILQTVEQLNQKIGGTIKLKGVPQIVHNLAQAKIEE